jgi:hypothetical protein
MALQNDTFGELKNLTFALIGREYADTTASFGRLKSLWNYAAKKAYRQSNWWERFLVIGEQRAIVNNNLIEQTEDSYTVSGSGTASVDGTYYRNGLSAQGLPKYTKYDSGGNAEYNIVDNPITTEPSGTVWVIENVTTASVVYSYSGPPAYLTPPLTGWTVSTGTAPAPTLSRTEAIDTFLRIHKADPLVRRADEYKFVVNKNGAYLSGRSGVPQSGLYLNSESGYYIMPTSTEYPIKNVFVTYKKAFDPNYGNAGDSEEIPAELLPYMAHYAAYTWQRSVEQNASENNFSLSLGLVNSILEDQLAKITDQNIFNSYIAKNIRTGYNQLIV